MRGEGHLNRPRWRGQLARAQKTLFLALLRKQILHKKSKNSSDLSDSEPDCNICNGPAINRVHALKNVTICSAVNFFACGYQFSKTILIKKTIHDIITDMPGKNIRIMLPKDIKLEDIAKEIKDNKEKLLTVLLANRGTKANECDHKCTGLCHSNLLHKAVKYIKPCPRPKAGRDHACPREYGNACEDQYNVLLKDINLQLPYGHTKNSAKCWETQSKHDPVTGGLDTEAKLQSWYVYNGIIRGPVYDGRKHPETCRYK